MGKTLEIRNLKAGYRKDNWILKGVNLDINNNETIAIIGKNGAGKSTLAKAIIGTTMYSEGSVRLFGDELTSIYLHSQRIAKHRIGYFQQGGKIFPTLTVEENLKFAGMKLDINSYYRNKKLVKSYFDLFKDNAVNKMKAAELSGGEKHQLALSMVLMTNPGFLILDEPSAGLSPINRGKIFSIIDNIRSELKISILLIEQNVNEAAKIAHKVCLLKLGRVEQLKNKNELQDMDEFFWS